MQILMNLTNDFVSFEQLGPESKTKLTLTKVKFDLNSSLNYQCLR